MSLATAATDPRQELLQLALSVFGVRFGVLRLAGDAPIASSPALPIEIEEPLAQYAAAHRDALVELQDAAAGIRFYAAAKLVDSDGGLRGILALLDDRPRTLTELQKDALLRIAAQVMRDVEMRETIRALREEQTPWWPLIDEAPVAVFCYHVSSSRLSYVNRKFAECLGYTVEEVLDLDSVTDIITEDQHDVVREMIRRREAGDDRELRYATKVRCRDGTVLDAEVHSSIADAGTGRIVIGVAVDITTQVASGRHLREREEYFRALTDHLSDVIAIVGGDGVLTYLSPSAARVLGYEPEELLGKTTWATVHPEDAGALGAALSELARGTTSEPREVRFQHKSGSWRTLEVVATNLLDHPQIRGSVLNLHDITDRKRMERELGHSTASPASDAWPRRWPTNSTT